MGDKESVGFDDSLTAGGSARAGSRSNPTRRGSGQDWITWNLCNG